MLKLYNTLSRKVEEFKPLKKGSVGFYACGPTVYLDSHIGHMRTYVGGDVIRRVLEFNNYSVKHVMNVTDVGHLTSDADEGEDKLEKGAKLAGKTVWEVAKHFEKQFFDSTSALNIKKPHVITHATKYIKEMINLIVSLEKKGYVYETKQGVYFNIKKFKNYTSLTGQKLEDKKQAVRKDVKTDPDKKHPADFALWLFTKGRFKNHSMHWESPWGEGFPGWHVECSAMSMRHLGETVDIHAGGIDHLTVHHPNEIAQSEAATGKQFVKYWVHFDFLKVDGKKMGKSLGNLYTVEDVKSKGIDPIALRYLYLTAHYRDSLNFTWESLKAAQSAYKKLTSLYIGLSEEMSRNTLSTEKINKVNTYRDAFLEAVNNDIDMPKALAVVWGAAKSNIPASDKYDLLTTFDEVMGLGLGSTKKSKIKVPTEVKKLVDERESYRKEGNFTKSDHIRSKISEKGYLVVDTDKGPLIKKI